MRVRPGALPPRRSAATSRRAASGWPRCSATASTRSSPRPGTAAPPTPAACLAELGFAALSREARAEPLGVPGLRELPVSVDYVRLSPEELGTRIAAAIGGGSPVGLMFHHAVMDDPDMRRGGRPAGPARRPRARAHRRG